MWRYKVYEVDWPLSRITCVWVLIIIIIIIIIIRIICLLLLRGKQKLKSK